MSNICRLDFKEVKRRAGDGHAEAPQVGEPDVESPERGREKTEEPTQFQRAAIDYLTYLNRD
jgi:hypothetical protein